jgi:tRNA uracil 4-sulfurtransferase
VKTALILHYHEIWLKGGNKKYYLSRLAAAVRAALADLPVESVEFLSDRFILIPGTESVVPDILERLKRVFGLAYVGIGRQTPGGFPHLVPVACDLMEECQPRTFAVRAKVADTDAGMNSMDVERELGRAILEHLRERNAAVQVSLREPEVTCQVEMVPGKSLVYARRLECFGGLPAATSGKVLTLLSGGFDSSVAAFKMMRRGAHVIFVHFFAPPGPSRGPSRPVAEDIVRTLTPYQFTSRLYLVPFEAVQREIVAAAPERFRVLLYRRMMARMAREIACCEGALGLVTGDSVSQVASQTLHNLTAMDRGLNMTVFRPLAGDDKQEILRLARQIGTYRISCEPFEDCCPRFLPRSPAIFAKGEELVKAEGALDKEALITRGLEGAMALDFKFERGRVEITENLPRRFQRLLELRRHAGVAPKIPPVPAQP